MASLAPIRSRFGRPVVPVLGLLAVVLTGCAQVGTASLTFWDIVFSMVALFFWFMFIWIFISLFGDIFRRDDLSGGMKALWLFVLVVLPFLGSLIYIISRPKVTPGDVARLTQMDAAVRAASSVSAADQLAKLAELKEAGAITVPEYEQLKKQVIG